MDTADVAKQAIIINVNNVEVRISVLDLRSERRNHVAAMKGCLKRSPYITVQTPFISLIRSVDFIINLKFMSTTPGSCENAIKST